MGLRAARSVTRTLSCGYSPPHLLQMIGLRRGRGNEGWITLLRSTTTMPPMNVPAYDFRRTPSLAPTKWHVMALGLPSSEWSGSTKLKRKPEPAESAPPPRPPPLASYRNFAGMYRARGALRSPTDAGLDGLLCCGGCRARTPFHGIYCHWYSKSWNRVMCCRWTP